MTDFLNIAGQTIPVAESQPVQTFSRGGSSKRMYLGNLRSTMRYEKREWKFVTQEMLQADMATLVAACALAAHITVNGNAIGGNVTCEVEVQEIPYLTAAGGDGLNFMRTATLIVREV